MSENDPYGSEGGARNDRPYPYYLLLQMLPNLTFPVRRDHRSEMRKSRRKFHSTCAKHRKDVQTTGHGRRPWWESRISMLNPLRK